MKKSRESRESKEEQQLIAAACQGDESAFETLIHLYEKRVFALTLRICGNPDDAAEAAQEAFLSAWQGLSHFRGASSFSTWLYRLTSNACIDLLRREKKRRAVSGQSLDDTSRLSSQLQFINLPDSSPSPQKLAEQKELREQINTGLQKLPLEQRQALILREIHQLSYDEISQVLQVDLGTIKSRISRGRQNLRRFLLESGNFSEFQASKSSEEVSGTQKPSQKSGRKKGGRF